MQRAEGSNKKGILSKKILGAVLTAVLVLGSVVLPQFSVMVRADEPVAVKTITGLGTGAITDPVAPASEDSAWSGSYVYYGKP